MHGGLLCSYCITLTLTTLICLILLQRGVLAIFLRSTAKLNRASLSLTSDRALLHSRVVRGSEITSDAAAAVRDRERTMRLVKVGPNEVRYEGPAPSTLLAGSQLLNEAGSDAKRKTGFTVKSLDAFRVALAKVLSTKTLIFLLPRLGATIAARGDRSTHKDYRTSDEHEARLARSRPAKRLIAAAAAERRHHRRRRRLHHRGPSDGRTP